MISAVLLASITVLTACNKGGPVTSDTDITTSSETEGDIYSDLPTGDYNDADFNIINNAFGYAEYRIDDNVEDAEDIMSEAVYKRTRAVEVALSIKINVTDSDFWTEKAAENVMFQILAGDDPYDLCSLGMMNNVPAITEGCYLDLNQVEGLDFSKPWWNTSSFKYCELGGKLYSANCEISANVYDQLWAGFFNKQIAEDYKLDMYSLVKNKEWTFDKLYELMELVASENGDEVIDKNDMFGLESSWGSAFGFLTASDTRVLDIEDGKPYVRDVSERMFDAYTKIQKILNADCTVTDHNRASYGFTEMECFKSGKSLILFQVMGNAAGMRSMDTDFGLIPFPKYDEAQEEYISYYSPATNGVCIPITVEDVERSSKVLVMMCAYGHRDVIPAYYDVVLEEKNMRDDESVEMLDIMFANVQTDLGAVYNWNGSRDRYMFMCMNGNDIMSTIDSSRGATEEAIEEFLKNIK